MDDCYNNFVYEMCMSSYNWCEFGNIYNSHIDVKYAISHYVGTMYVVRV